VTPRVLFVSNISNMSGAETVLLDTVEPTSSSVDYLVLAPRGGLLDECRRRGIRTQRSWGLRELERARSWWWPLEFLLVWPVAVLEIAAHALAHRAAIVHVNNFAAGLYGLPAARLTAKSAIWTIHDLFPEGSTEGRMIRWLSRGKTRLMAVSQAVAENLIVHGVDPAKVVVVRNAIDAERFDPARYIKGAFRDRHGIDEDEFVVATVGQITRGKGIDLLLDVARRIKPSSRVRFVLAGTAPPVQRSYEAQVRRRIEDDPILRERIILVGRLSEPAELLADSDALVHPALYPEAFGLAVLEGMAMELVVIAPRSGGIVELVTDDTGVLYRPGDADDLLRRLEEVISDPERAVLGCKARARVTANFDAVVRKEKVLELYRGLME
jgi:glycosyltransferase involved in cell wall biosynthesis